MKSVLSLLLATTIALFSFAPQASAKPYKEKEKVKEEESEQPCKHRPIQVSLSPRYFKLNTSGYTPFFTSGGVSGPKSGAIGSDLNVYWTSPEDWLLGFGVGGVSTSNDRGSAMAEYSQNYFGFLVGKKIPLDADFEVDLSNLFAGGFAHAEVLSTSSNGRTNEGSFLIIPKLAVEYKAGTWFKLGLSGSYVQPVSQSDSTRGLALNPGDISLHGWSAGVDFIFGHDREE